MAQNPQQAQIFNHELRALRRARAARRLSSGKGDAFLLVTTGALAAEKLVDVNRQFKKAVIIGLPAFQAALMEALPDDRKPAEIETFEDWPDQWPAQWLGSVDLIISGLVLQSRNDVPELVRAAGHAMTADGLMINALLGGESLLGLRRACFALDQAKRDGAVPRVAPMIDLQQAAGLLAYGGFAQPVLDRDKLNLSYKTLETLVRDLRDIGETCSLTAGDGRYPGRDFLTEMENQFPARSDTDGFSVRFDIIWMSGWTPHESQQTPQKPGSAKMKLSDALKNIRS